MRRKKFLPTNHPYRNVGQGFSLANQKRTPKGLPYYDENSANKQHTPQMGTDKDFWIPVFTGMTDSTVSSLPRRRESRITDVGQGFSLANQKRTPKGLPYYENIGQER